MSGDTCLRCGKEMTNRRLCNDCRTPPHESNLDQTTSPSKYVTQTGDGYRGTYTVSADHTVTISTAAIDSQHWPSTTVHAITHKDGVAIVPPSETTDPLAEYTLCTRYDGARIAAGPDVTDELEVDPNDEVRVYDLATIDDRDGLLLVDADDDPRLATDGGHDTAPDSDHDLELVLEYTTINNRRRRITIVPDTGGEAWRITHEIRKGEWRETGREPISELTIHLDNADADRPAELTKRPHTVDELLKQRGETQ
ncbi:hypothetical protein [Natrialba swarupiae]|uniref:hypothetical protein n=1 Tax=Natrialba swarupiae TaxID=2448032 RepID=UPI00192E5311|nr:hypothetical protein [Natrialba swarupiae]